MPYLNNTDPDDPNSVFLAQQNLYGDRARQDIATAYAPMGAAEEAMHALPGAMAQTGWQGYQQGRAMGLQQQQAQQQHDVNQQLMGTRASEEARTQQKFQQEQALQNMPVDENGNPIPQAALGQPQGAAGQPGTQQMTPQGQVPQGQISTGGAGGQIPPQGANQSAPTGLTLGQFNASLPAKQYKIQQQEMAMQQQQLAMQQGQYQQANQLFHQSQYQYTVDKAALYLQNQIAQANAANKQANVTAMQLVKDGKLSPGQAQQYMTGRAYTADQAQQDLASQGIAPDAINDAINKAFSPNSQAEMADLIVDDQSGALKLRSDITAASANIANLKSFANSYQAQTGSLFEDEATKKQLATIADKIEALGHPMEALQLRSNTIKNAAGAVIANTPATKAQVLNNAISQIQQEQSADLMARIDALPQVSKSRIAPVAMKTLFSKDFGALNNIPGQAQGQQTKPGQAPLTLTGFSGPASDKAGTKVSGYRGGPVRPLPATNPVNPNPNYNNTQQIIYNPKSEGGL
jgi:polyhydroxyalkanoate synthesis regulator phasin